MSRELSNSTLFQIFAQESNDPFLVLFTLTHSSFTTIRLVNNMVDVVSRGQTFKAFPVNVTLPSDDGESAREVLLELDNASLELIQALRTVTTPIAVKIEMVLASIPNTVQMSLEELQITQISYNKTSISARLMLDGFLATEIPSEKYGPGNFPGIF